MKKRILLLILAVAMIMPQLAVHADEADVADAAPETETVAVVDTAVEETVETEISSKQKLLIALDIMNVDSYGQIDNAKEVTRVDFVGVAGKMISINPTFEADKVYYKDLTNDHWAAYAANMLVDMQVLTMPEDRLFNPYKTITFNEAVKMLVCMLGYRDYAENTGGFPYGYLSVANQIGLLRGVKIDEKVTNGILSDLLYNAINTKILETVSFGDEVTYTNENAETLLSKYREIYSVSGVIQSVHGVSLIDKAVPMAKCIIGGVTYERGKADIYPMLGYRVKAYYSKDNDDVKTLIYADPKNNKEFKVTDEEYIDFANGKLIYRTEEGTRKDEDIAASATVVRNGGIVKTGLDAAYDITNGEIRLVDNNDDNVYDIVLIEDYNTMVVNVTNEKTKTIIDAIDPKNIVDLSDPKYEYISIYSTDGTGLDFSAIGTGSVIDVAISDKHAIIYVNVNNFEGTVTGMDDSEKLIFVDGAPYKYFESAYKKYLIENDASGTFKTNKYGKIAYFSKAADTINIPGYLIKAAAVGAIKGTIQLKMLTTADKVEVLELASNARIENAKATVASEALLIENQGKVIVYRVNEEGKITYIDLPETLKDGEKSDGTLKLVKKLVKIENDGRDSHKEIAYIKASSQFGRTTPCKSDSVVFKVPESDVDAKDSDYKLEKMTMFIDDYQYNVDIYKTGVQTAANIIVTRDSATALSLSTTYDFVKSVRPAVTADGEKVKRMTVYKQGALQEFDIPDDYKTDYIPTKGDMVRFAYDSNRRVTIIETHYDFETQKGGRIDPASSDWAAHDPVTGNREDAVTWWKGMKHLHREQRFIPGHAVEIEGTILKWGVDEIGSENIFEMRDIKSTTPIIVSDVAEDTFRAGTLGDIKPSTTFGKNCSELLMTSRYAAITAIYVINNRPKS